MGIMVPRSEAAEVEAAAGWVLVYGRRKTGKTYMVRNMVHHDRYFFVTRGGGVYDASAPSGPLPYPVFRERLSSLLSRRAVVVVDEFQRLPGEFIDFLHYSRTGAEAKLVLVGSSFHVSRRLLAPRSPLLGLLAPVRVGLVSPRDILYALRGMGGFEALRRAPLLRDPWILGLVDPEAGFTSLLGQIVSAIRVNARGLVGEAFLEEDRELTARYEAVLRAVADGYHSPGLVAGYLSGLHDSPLRSQDVKRYMAILVETGLLRRIRIYGKKRYFYLHESPLLDLAYHLDARLGFFELEPPRSLLLEAAESRIPIYYEQFVVEALALLLDATPQKSLRPEIDGVLVRRGRPVAVVEVKYGSASTRDVHRFIEKTGHIHAPRILVARDAPGVEGVRHVTPDELLEALLGEAALSLE